MKKIIVISEGDPYNPKTWSNIPYFLVKNLKLNGNTVYTINLGINKYINFIFNKVFYPFIQIIDGKDSEYKLNRTKIYERYCEYKIRKCLKIIDNPDVIISTSYSFAPKISENYKIILLCDWTFEYHIQNYKKRIPTKLEMKAIYRQEEILNRADLIISLFPNIAEVMKQKFSKVKYIGNVINVSENLNINLENKYKSNSILFIGGKRYLSGAKTLIQAVSYLNEKLNLKLHVNIIGLTNDDLLVKNVPYVYCYGYLNKLNKNDDDIYYDLITKSKICINTTPTWAGFSSIIEAMYLYTPIITSKYDSFHETFGNRFNPNYYCKNDYIMLSKKILEVYNMSKANYLDLCNNMRELVSDMSWDGYVKKLEKEISKL